MGIGISLDFLNQMLYQIWGAVFEYVFVGWMGLDGDETALIFPGQISHFCGSLYLLLQHHNQQILNSWNFRLVTVGIT